MPSQGAFERRLGLLPHGSPGFTPSAPLVTDFPKLLGIIRENTVDAEPQESLHLGHLVDRPDQRFETQLRGALDHGRGGELFLNVDRFGAELARDVERVFLHPRAVKNADARIGGQLADALEDAVIERGEHGALEVFVMAQSEKQLELDSQSALRVSFNVDVEI